MAPPRASTQLSPLAATLVATVAVALGTALVGPACGGGNSPAGAGLLSAAGSHLGDDGGTPGQCEPPPSTNTCTDPTRSQCNLGCCPAGAPFVCERTSLCYASQAEALAACGNVGTSCQACNTTPGAGTVCRPAPATNTCTDPTRSQCNLGCCPAGSPYVCELTNLCYATQAEALAACGNAGSSCQACNTSALGGSGAACRAGPARPAGVTQQQCATVCAIGTSGVPTCCGASAPFYCASNNGCYATAAAAQVVCGTACAACSP